MASENMNRWARTYDLDKTQLYPLDVCSVYLFQTKSVVRHQVNEDMHGRAPLYHLWVNDKEVYCGPNMQEAYSMYRDALRKGLMDAST